MGYDRWISQLRKWNGRNIVHTSPTVQIFTDASNDGWGIVFDDHFYSGQWATEEKHLHINHKELQVVHKALLLLHRTHHQHLGQLQYQLCIDNITAIPYINKFGGTCSLELNTLAMRIWQYCFQHNIYLSTLYIPSKYNPADAPSRQLHDEIEWYVPQPTFDWLNTLWGPHTIDLFASPQNTKIPSAFVSYNYHPNVLWVNAFSRPWCQLSGRLYLAPPWNLILRILQRLQQLPQPATLITLNWPFASWYPLALHLAQRDPIILQQDQLLD